MMQMLGCGNIRNILIGVVILSFLVSSCKGRGGDETPPRLAAEPRVITAPVLPPTGKISAGELVREETAKRLVLQYPQSAFAHYELGRVLHAKRRFKDAIPVFQRSIQLDPLLLGAYMGLAECYRYSQPPQWEQAEASIRSLLNRAYTDEQRSEAYNALGNLYLDRHMYRKHLGDLEQAIRFYEKSLKLAPRDAGAAFGIGIALARQEKLREAEPWFERALEWARTPREKAKALEALANIAAAFGDEQRAQDLIEEARRVHPAYPATLWERKRER